jgi:hypothetical protein
VLLWCLADDGRLGLWAGEGAQMLKALNMMMMKVLENCNRWVCVWRGGGRGAHRSPAASHTQCPYHVF